MIVRFDDLQYLWLLFAIPAQAVFFFWAMRRRRKDLLLFAEAGLLKNITAGVNFVVQKLRPVITLFVLFFLVLSLIQPKWGYHWQEIKTKGIDIIIALDLSKSMLAEDIKPNRFEAARREIKSLVNMAKGDRIGIVGFAGTAFTQCPLTTDYGTLKLFLDNMRVGIMPLGGTDITRAIREGLRALGKNNNHRVLIVITDGEDHSQGAVDAARAAQKQGVKIYLVGTGSRDGAPIPAVDKQGTRSFVKDGRGEVVVSRLDDTLMKKIAAIGGGRMGVIGTGSFPLEDIYLHDLSKIQKNEMESSQRKRFENRFQLPLFIALILYFIEGILTGRKKPKSNNG